MSEDREYNRVAIERLDDGELVGTLGAVQFRAVASCNDALIELCEAGPWLAGAAACAGFVVALVGGAPWPIEPGRAGVALAVAALALLCLAGARWHYRRGRAALALVRRLEQAREALAGEMARRGLDRPQRAPRPVSGQSSGH